MISATDRRQALELIDEARTNGAHLDNACKELGICKRISSLEKNAERDWISR